MLFRKILRIFSYNPIKPMVRFFVVISVVGGWRSLWYAGTNLSIIFTDWTATFGFFLHLRHLHQLRFCHMKEAHRSLFISGRIFSPSSAQTLLHAKGNFRTARSRKALFSITWNGGIKQPSCYFPHVCEFQARLIMTVTTGSMLWLSSLSIQTI